MFVCFVFKSILIFGLYYRSSGSKNAYCEYTAINTQTTAVMLPNTKQIARAGRIGPSKAVYCNTSWKLLNNKGIAKAVPLRFPHHPLFFPYKPALIPRTGTLLVSTRYSGSASAGFCRKADILASGRKPFRTPEPGSHSRKALKVLFRIHTRAGVRTVLSAGNQPFFFRKKQIPEKRS